MFSSLETMLNMDTLMLATGQEFAVRPTILEHGTPTMLCLVQEGCLDITTSLPHAQLEPGHSIIGRADGLATGIIATSPVILKVLLFDFQLLFTLQLEAQTLKILHHWMSEHQHQPIISTSIHLSKAMALLESLIPNLWKNSLSSFNCALKALIYEAVKPAPIPFVQTYFSNRQREIYFSFFRLASENFKKERTLAFYADRLAITARHLSSVVKKQSGLSACEILDNMVIQQTKNILLNTSLTVAQIADQLSFSDQVNFGKFFKRHTGRSPKIFRQIHLENL